MRVCACVCVRVCACYVCAYVHACPYIRVRMFGCNVKLLDVCVRVYVEDAYSSGQHADRNTLCSVPTFLPLPLPTEIPYMHIYIMHPGLRPVSCMVAPIKSGQIWISSNNTENAIECMRA